VVRFRDSRKPKSPSNLFALSPRALVVSSEASSSFFLPFFRLVPFSFFFRLVPFSFFFRLFFFSFFCFWGKKHQEVSRKFFLKKKKEKKILEETGAKKKYKKKRARAKAKKKEKGRERPQQNGTSEERYYRYKSEQNGQVCAPIRDQC
jgi:hypothetical protein